MKTCSRGFAAAAVLLAAALAAAAAEGVETCKLELKRLPSAGGIIRIATPSDYMYRSTYPQHFSSVVGPVQKGRVTFSGAEEQQAAFKRIVQKEPKYASEYPFPGVAKLGSQEFAFALDVAPAKAETPPEKPIAEKAGPAGDAGKTKGAKPEAEKSGGDSTAGEAKAAAPARPSVPPSVRYNRLYFDLNHNGDLTDDQPIEAEAMPGYISPPSYARFQFPRVDVVIEVAETKVDYSFFLSGYISASSDFNYAGVSLNAAAYREGEMVLEGKNRHIVLLDFNSNGRFDDQLTLRSDVKTSDGRMHSTQGDMLLVDPNPSRLTSPYDPTSSPDRHNLSKLVNIDGRYYDLEVSPAGDKLTFTPSASPLGAVTTGHKGFRGLLYGEKGVIKIGGSEGEPVAVPEGEWKLLSYTIDRTGWGEEKDAADEKAKDNNKAKPEQSSLLGTLAKALGAAGQSSGRGGPTQVSAAGTKDCPAVVVRKGETTALKCGPPYKPLVTVDYRNGNTAELGMALVGAGGERCTSLMVNGGQPPKPRFTIRDLQDEVIEQGTFEYG